MIDFHYRLCWWRAFFFLHSSVFLGNIKTAFDKNPKLTNLLLDPFFTDAIHRCQKSWRNVVANAAILGVPTPAFSTALAFYDGYRCARLPANLLQVYLIYHVNCAFYFLVCRFIRSTSKSYSSSSVFFVVRNLQFDNFGSCQKVLVKFPTKKICSKRAWKLC